MKAFALEEWTAALVESATPRIERHGKDSVVALSLGLKITGSNLLIDLASETLRHGIYAADETQETLPEIEHTTPILRAPELAGLAIPLAAQLEGAIVYVDHGVDGEDDPIVLNSVKVDKLRVSPMKGGSIELTFRIGTNDVSEEVLGILCGKLGHETRIRIEPPLERVDSGLTIDGTTGHPGAGPLFGDDDEPDEGATPTDTFIAQHGAEAEA